MTNINIEKFQTLTDAYRSYVELSEKIKEYNTQIEQNFARPDGSPVYSPLSYDYKLEHLIKETRDGLVRFVISEMQRDQGFKNINIDEGDIQRYIKESEGFDAASLVDYIQKKYQGRDGEALKHIIIACKGLLPWGSFGDSTRGIASKPEHLTRVNSSGIELRFWGQRDYEKAEKISPLLKLVDIVLRGEKPSEAKGQYRNECNYTDDKIKSLRVYKNGKLKVVFQTSEDCEKIINALVGSNPSFFRRP